jgi:hypothetical protein
VSVRTSVCQGVRPHSASVATPKCGHCPTTSVRFQVAILQPMNEVHGMFWAHWPGHNHEQPRRHTNFSNQIKLQCMGLVGRTRGRLATSTVGAPPAGATAWGAYHTRTHAYAHTREHMHTRTRTHRCSHIVASMQCSHHAHTREGRLTHLRMETTNGRQQSRYTWTQSLAPQAAPPTPSPSQQPHQPTESSVTPSWCSIAEWLEESMKMQRLFQIRDSLWCSRSSCRPAVTACQ